MKQQIMFDLIENFVHKFELDSFEEHEQQLSELQNLANDASIRLNEGSEVIRKLQKHLKICQEKVSNIKITSTNIMFVYRSVV